jgi:hypothetical protein
MVPGQRPFETAVTVVDSFQREAIRTKPLGEKLAEAYIIVNDQDTFHC